jgi:hypothetical protein
MTPTVRFAVFSVVCVVLGSMSQSLVAFNLLDYRWPAGVINMELELCSATGLIDGSGSWDDCATASLVELNDILAPTGRSFNAVRGSIRTPVQGDSVNSVFFSDDYFGTPYGAQTLARTVVLSYIDLEGKAVWLQEYLRYRVNGCSDAEGLSRVQQRIRTGITAPVCAT